jgi:hypothetical protein
MFTGKLLLIVIATEHLDNLRKEAWLYSSAVEIEIHRNHTRLRLVAIKRV